MLRKIRIALSAIMFVAVTLLFLDFTGTIHAWLGWSAKIQLFPAFAALNFGIVVLLLVLTFVFGRVYCSVICPMGIFQDIISRCRGKLKKKNRFRFSYTKGHNILRYMLMAVFAVTAAAGFMSIASLIEPYSAWGRICSNLLAPLWDWGGNLLAKAGDHFGAYTMYSKDVWLRSLSSLVTAAATLAAIAFLAWKKGRLYCNSICPVGSFLSIISRYSLMGPVIDTDKCRNCGLCGKQCKASCIDTENHCIDYSRCIDCMDCLDSCHEGAIKYTFKKKKKTESDKGRRAFMASAALVAASAAVPARAKSKPLRERKSDLTPPGSGSAAHFHRHCTACQLCVSVCPNNVLVPSTDPEHFMQPKMCFDKGHCRPECTKCSQVCPNNAIKDITPEEKTSISIGYAVVDLSLCVAHKEEAKCGNCARHCPAGAIKLVKKEGSDIRIPAVDRQKCIGCGACEHLCPSRPVKAIHIEGYEVHQDR